MQCYLKYILPANKLKNLTERKMFRVYCHSLTIHAHQQYRIMSGRTANTEKEEAMFTTIKKTHQPNK